MVAPPGYNLSEMAKIAEELTTQLSARVNAEAASLNLVSKNPAAKILYPQRGCRQYLGDEQNPFAAKIWMPPDELTHRLV